MKKQALASLALVLLLFTFFSVVDQSGAETVAWKIQTVDAVGAEGGYSSLALDSQGYPHVSYFDSANTALKYASFNGADWETQTVLSSGDIGRFTSLALDSNNLPHISCFDKTNTDLVYVNFDGAAWSSEIVDADALAETTSIALNSTGNPCIAYCGGATDLKYAKQANPVWTTKIVDSAGSTGIFASLAFDNSDKPHIAYMDFTNKDLKYAKFTGSSWATETVDSTGEVGRFVSLALTNNGNPCIAYCDTTQNDLKYATWTGTEWNIQVVDTNAYSYADLVLDSQGNPCIAYLGASSAELKYAKWSGSSWETQTVASAQSPYESGQVSLALSPTGNPIITYIDAGNLLCARLTSSYTITFAQVGADSYNGTVLTVDQVNYTAGALPVSFIWDEGTMHSYNFMSPLNLTADNIIVWASTTGILNQKNADFTVTTGGTILGTYQPQTDNPTPTASTSTPTVAPSTNPTATQPTQNTPANADNNLLIIIAAIVVVIVVVVVAIMVMRLRKS
ncbi:MAG: hypothetical protein NWE92_06770 [Candidatus Bathyarchaeota archaeon]|nr:hypothetical protein [Candidatus Bathyarchaeota archaeon]